MQKEQEQIVVKEMTLEDLYASKKYKKGSVTYLEPQAYIQPLIDMIPPDAVNFARIDVDVDNETINTNEDGSENISYGRVSVKIILDIKEDISFTFGLVYGLDMQRPLIKTFIGTEVRTCTNLCIFNADHITVACLLDDYSIVYKTMKPLLENYNEIMTEHLRIIKEMSEKVITKGEVHTMLGELLEASCSDKQLGKQSIIFASDQLFDKNSKYYCGEETTFWNVYNSFTQYITDKIDILETPNRTFNLFKYFAER